MGFYDKIKAKNVAWVDNSTPTPDSNKVSNDTLYRNTSSPSPQNQPEPQTMPKVDNKYTPTTQSGRFGSQISSQNKARQSWTPIPKKEEQQPTFTGDVEKDLKTSLHASLTKRVKQWQNIDADVLEEAKQEAIKGIQWDPNEINRIASNLFNFDQKEQDKLLKGLMDLSKQNTKLRFQDEDEIAMNIMNGKYTMQDVESLIGEADPARFQQIVAKTQEYRRVNKGNSLLTGWENVDVALPEVATTSSSDIIAEFQNTMNENFQYLMSAFWNKNSLLEAYDAMVNTEEISELESQIASDKERYKELERDLKSTRESIKKEFDSSLSKNALAHLEYERTKEIRDEMDGLADSINIRVDQANGLRSDAKERFSIMAQDRAIEEQRAWQLVQYKTDMDIQTFNKQWDLFNRQLDREEKEYWATRDMEDKVYLMWLSEDMRRQAAERDYNFSLQNGWNLTSEKSPDWRYLFRLNQNGQVVSTLDLKTGKNVQSVWANWLPVTEWMGIYNRTPTSLWGKFNWDYWIDFDVEMWESIASFVWWTVSDTWVDWYGNNFVKVTTEDWTDVIYRHLGEIWVAKWQTIASGDIIGTGGNSGYVMDANGNVLRGKDWTVYNQEALDQWFGSHLDVTIREANGRYIKWEEALKFIWESWGVTDFIIDDMLNGVAPVKLWMTESAAKTFDASFSAVLAAWDKKTALSMLEEAYRSKLTAEGKKKIDWRRDLMFSIDVLEDKLNNYVDEGWDLWFFTGKKEDILNRIWKTSDKRTAALQTEIMDLLDKVARDRTGAALTKDEEDFYRRLLPGIGKSIELNQAIVDGLKSSLWSSDSFIKYEIARLASDDVVEWLFAEDTEFLKDLGFVLPQQSSDAIDVMWLLQWFPITPTSPDLRPFAVENDPWLINNFIRWI